MNYTQLLLGIAIGYALAYAVGSFTPQSISLTTWGSSLVTYSAYIIAGIGVVMALKGFHKSLGWGIAGGALIEQFSGAGL